MKDNYFFLGKINIKSIKYLSEYNLIFNYK